MTLPSSQIDLIATQILLDAQAALKSLADFGNSTLTAGEKVKVLKQIIERMAVQAGVSLDKAAKMFEIFAGKLTNIEKKALAAALALAKLNQTANIQGANPLYSKEQEAQANEAYDNFVKQTMIAAEFQDKKDTWFEKDYANQDKLFEQTQEGYVKEEQAAANLQKKKEQWWANDIANQDKSFEKTLAAYKSLEEAVPRVATQNFGDINAYVAQATNKVQAWKTVIKSVMAETGGSVEAVGAQLKKMVSGASVAPLTKAMKELGGATEDTARKSKYSIDIIRTALGVLTAMLVNVVLSAIVNFAKESVKAFTDVEEALWRIHVAEKRLSEQGVEITFRGLLDEIQKIKEELKIFSEPDLLSSASTFASGLAKFGFTEKQIAEATKYAAILNVVSQASESLQESTDKLMTAYMSPQSRSVQSLNLQFGEQRMQLIGLKLGFLEAGEGAKNLTLNEQALVKQEIVKEEALAALEEYNKYLETNSAKIKENAASWEDVQKAAGGFFTMIIPNVNWLNEFLANMISSFKGLFAETYAALQTLGDVVGEFVGGIIKGKSATESLLDSLKNIKEEYKSKVMVLIDHAFADDMPEWLRKGMEGRGFVFQDTLETPTIPQVADEDIVSPEALAALDELEDDLLEIAADAETARRELQILTQQKYDDIRIDAQIKLEEIELKFQQDVADAERELQQEIDDIHIEARQAEADAMRQYREDQLRAEAEYQQKLKELREQFLMDLDEALHARDARQVLKLIKQYEFEKQQAKERKELDDKLRKERLQAELESIRIEEQRRVEAAQREFARKMQELEIEKQREIEAANEAEKQKLEELARWNAAEMEEIDRHAKDKMEKLTAAYEAEFGAHKLYQEMINRVIAEYTAANIRAMQDMYNYMVGLYAQIGAMYASSQGMLNSMGGVVGTPQPQNPFPYHPGGYAEGGSVIAMRPTRAIFGERGPELATFTPLGRDGRDVNKLFGDLPSSAGGGGRMLIEMLLSPDLEARVIENSLSRTADVFARVSRSK